MRSLGWFGGASGIRERVPLAFGIGYGAITIACALSTFLHLSLTQAFAALTAVTILFALAPRRTVLSHMDAQQGEEHKRTFSFALPLAIGLAILCGWVIEPPITGEETAELISVRKIAENPFLSMDGLMPEPSAVPTYVIAPYYFLVALVSKASGLSIFAAYLKLRAVYAGLALLVFSALGSRLLPRDDPRVIEAMTLGLLVLFFADPAPWSWPASLFPLVRRGAFTAGVAAPIFMLAAHVFVMRPNRESRPLGEWIAPGLLLLTLLTTHAMEILWAGFFTVAMMVAGRLLPAAGVDWRRVASFVVSVAVAALVFKTAHARLAGHVYAFDASARADILGGLRAELGAGAGSFFGVSDAGRYLVSTSGAVIPYTILGILLSPILIRWRPVAGVILWAGTALPLGVYCSSKLLALLQLATASEIVFVFGYFTLLGLLGFLATTYIAVSAQAARRPEWFKGQWKGSLLSVAAMPVGYGLALLLRAALPVLLARPLAVFWIAALGGIVALSWRRRGQDSARGAPFSWSAAAVFVALLAGGGWGLKGTGQIAGAREPLLQTLGAAWRSASVLEWPRYYPVLQASANPPIDLPAPIVEDLTRLLPPLQTLIADPAHSYSLPVMLNQHIVNPGHRISTSLDYFDHYTHEEGGRRVHPIFNDTTVLSAEERRFLVDFQVQYILVNPSYEEVVAQKLGAEPQTFTLIYSRNGFLLYKVN